MSVIKEWIELRDHVSEIELRDHVSESSVVSIYLLFDELSTKLFDYVSINRLIIYFIHVVVMIVNETCFTVLMKHKL